MRSSNGFPLTVQAIEPTQVSLVEVPPLTVQADKSAHVYLVETPLTEVSNLLCFVKGMLEDQSESSHVLALFIDRDERDL